ncbi:GDSL-type esterase/lipase family protein [Treponema primitia]|uniref:GDSL-type esterase/lipase family protein n=1 Tax=Treponema primitia TaxID=88058 RepID=UPI0002554F52|nr:GDSL-type esterase/lipase family protein [Treponema primitia]
MKHILCFGDSNSWGWDAESYDLSTGIAKRMPYEVRWPGLAQKLLGSEYHIIENTLNARTLMWEDPYQPHRLGLASLEETLDANAPLDLVILQLGANELKQMFNLSARKISRGLDKLVLTAQQEYYGYPVPQVLVIAPAPVSPDIGKYIFGHEFGPQAYEKSLEFSCLYKQIAASRGCAFIDCAPLKFTLNPRDGLHYSREDHTKLGSAVADKIRELLG